MYDQRWSDDWIQSEFDTTLKDFIFCEVLAELERRRSKSGAKSLLDIGAHVGRFIHLASREGWQAEGVELNPRTAAFAAKTTGLPVHRENAEKLAASDKRYAAITLTDVLEHIPNPVPILRSAHALLEYGGWIAVKVPCGPSQIIKETIRAKLRRRGDAIEVATNLVHVNHFSPESLRLALEKSGFKNIVVTTGAPEFIDRQAAPGLRTGLSNLFRWSVFEAARLLPLGVNTPLAMNLQAYAQKAVVDA